jgi:succinate dehydrogenase hydrophobic anchor subunit
MDIKRVLGVVILVIGVVLLGFAFHSSNAPLEQLSDSMTGRYSDETMLLFMIGTAAAVGGGLIAFLGARK